MGGRVFRVIPPPCVPTGLEDLANHPTSLQTEGTLLRQPLEHDNTAFYGLGSPSDLGGHCPAAEG